MNLSIQKLFYSVATVFGLFAILILAKSILIPLAFALLFAFILYPLVKKFQKWGLNDILSAFTSIISIILILGGVIYLFSSQLMLLSQEFSKFNDKIINAFTKLSVYINDQSSFSNEINEDQIFNRTKDWLFESSGAIIETTFTNTTAFIAGLTLTIIFTFLILLYRNGLVSALSAFFSQENKTSVIVMYKSIQEVGQKYLGGMLTVLLIIGLANSIGLWIIGIDSPFLFGFLGAMLSIVPYVGTVSGAIIPMLHAFASNESLWVLFYIGILFWVVQIITDNFLSPKIIGNHVKINPFAAILSLIIGASVWGVAGMILFLPYTAMFKVVCENYKELQPIGRLIGDKNYGESTTIKFEWLNKIKNKILNVFKTVRE
jgi:predicted PurR-regulated permease PerM